jgi:hypothetical protein
VEEQKDAMLETALYYRKEFKWSVVPLMKGTKDRPLVKWSEYQKRLPRFDEIISWWSQWPGSNIAIVTGKVSNLMVIDHDSYKPEYNHDEVLKYISDSVSTTTAISPKGGTHQYFTCPDETISIKAGLLPGLDYRCEGGFIVAPPSTNGEGGAYKWVVDPCLQLSTVPAGILELIKSNIYNNRGGIVRGGGLQLSTVSTTVYTQGSRDQDLFHIANLLVKAGCEPQYLEKTLKIIALGCEPPFPLDEVDAKIRSALERAEKRERNLMQEVKEHLCLQSDYILSTETAKCLQLSTRNDLKNLSVCFTRLVKEGVIERVKGKVGMFRIIDKDEEQIDYKNADTTPLEIKFPFGIHEYVQINRGNLIILAGESNAGKTGFCLNVAKMNKDRFKINYMSSEMKDGAELRIRLDKFPEPIESWDKIKFQFRTDNFADKIDPDGFNIIDYLDEGSDQEAYKMSMRLRIIADKLQGGVALVCIQKDPNKVFGFGGSGTLNRSRLYMTITHQNYLTLVKAKIWRQDTTNPNGMKRRFKIIGGSAYIQDGEWEKP